MVAVAASIHRTAVRVAPGPALYCLVGHPGGNVCALTGLVDQAGNRVGSEPTGAERGSKRPTSARPAAANYLKASAPSSRSAVGRISFSTEYSCRSRHGSRSPCAGKRCSDRVR